MASELRRGGGGHSKTNNCREIKFRVKVAKTFVYLVPKFCIHEVTRSRVMSRHDVTHRASGWRHMRHAILRHAETVWGRGLILGVLVATTYLYLLTQFCFPEITRLDVMLRVVTSCDVWALEQCHRMFCPCRFYLWPVFFSAVWLWCRS